MFIFQDLEPLEAAMTQCWACEGLIKVHPLVRSMLVPFQKLHSDWKICACSIQFARQTVCAVVQGLKVYQPDGQVCGGSIKLNARKGLDRHLS